MFCSVLRAWFSKTLKHMLESQDSMQEWGSTHAGLIVGLRPNEKAVYILQGGFVWSLVTIIVHSILIFNNFKRFTYSNT